MTDSILTSIKKLLGIEAEYTQFDVDITMHINSTFAKLQQIGIGDQQNTFFIEDENTTWDEFIQGAHAINMVKSYMYTSVRLLFDPPGTSYLIEAMQNQASEYEWRMRELQKLFTPEGA